MKKVLLFILIICSVEFWGFFLVPKPLMYLGYIFSWMIMGYCLLFSYSKKDIYFKNCVILFLIGIFTNILSAYINHGQSFWMTFLAFKNYTFILLYFYLSKNEVSEKYVERLIIFFAIVFSIFYLIQMSVYPLEIFETKIYEDRGTLRIRLLGNGFLGLAILMQVNQFFIKKRLINLVMALAFFCVLILGGFRLLPLTILFCSGLIFFRINKFSLKSIMKISAIGIFLIIVLVQIPFIYNILEEMILRSESDIDRGQDSIRFIQFSYFFYEFTPNIGAYILGNGLPNGDSTYGQEHMLIQEQSNLFWMDLGLLGLWIVAGGVIVIAILWYSVKAIFTSVPKEKFYLVMYFLYLVMVSFTSAEIFRIGLFGVQAIVLYLIDKSRVKSLEINR
ncbi:hypothetical protein [Dysgonomonas gadei]|uniref:O-antigen polymerase n=1 Tax=Dysgonomonas gadei ATCC BAA-286 TaxID=742766 RepID=F5IUQ3_9BACT|nr:hypothetical protein [Dysgonomonas gadei]EGK02953.1 hypothetical protein HMPREF9455_01203 [Dysgonomonas gadei ATCC BAA-286]